MTNPELWERTQSVCMSQLMHSIQKFRSKNPQHNSPPLRTSQVFLLVCFNEPSGGLKPPEMVMGQCGWCVVFM